MTETLKRIDEAIRDTHPKAQDWEKNWAHYAAAYALFNCNTKAFHRMRDARGEKLASYAQIFWRHKGCKNDALRVLNWRCGR